MANKHITKCSTSLVIEENTNIPTRIATTKKKNKKKSRNQRGYGISLVAQMVKNLPAIQATWVGFVDREDPGDGNDYPLQDSCLGNSMDQGDWG